MEKEITVLVETSYDVLHKLLTKNKFEIKEEYDVNDIYMVDSSIDIKSLHNLEILSKCVIVREIPNVTKKLVYKNKVYASNGDILKQKKINCPISDINKGIEFMEAINYKKLFSINDKCIVYANDRTQLVVQLVNNEYIFIEVESECEYIDRVYKDIEEMKYDLDSYNLPYNKNNYFVKKAELMLENINKV